MRTIFLLVILVFAFGCKKVDDAHVNKIVALTPDVEAGAATYGQNCSACHGSDGKGGTTKKQVLPELDKGDQAIIPVILAGKTGMPGFQEVLSDQEIADVLGYLKTLR